jgi:hypothetical protein
VSQLQRNPAPNPPRPSGNQRRPIHFASAQRIGAAQRNKSFSENRFSILSIDSSATLRPSFALQNAKHHFNQCLQAEN